MINIKLPIIIVGIFVLFIALVSEIFFTISPIEQAIVLQFGEYKHTIREPGLHFKLPFLDNLIRFDKRILSIDSVPEQITTTDKKRLVVDIYTRYKIIDPLLFYKRLHNELQAESKLSSIIGSSLKSILGKTSFDVLLSDKRSSIMEEVQEHVEKSVSSMGITIVDVRIRRADLPPENSEKIFQLMKSERDRIAKDLRARGQEKAREIRANADREKTVIVAQASKEATMIRGDGEAKAAHIYAQAFKSNREFYDFYRSMQAYRKALKPENTRYVLNPKEGDFFKFLK
jgi:membrane protease subunit HflC